MRSFRVRLFLLALLFLGITIALAIVFANPNYLFTQLVLALLWVFSILGLIKLVDSTNKQVARFIEAVQFGDFQISFSNKGSKTEEELSNQFNNALIQLKDRIGKNNEELEFANQVLSLISISIWVSDNQGNILWKNPSFSNHFSGKAITNDADFESINGSLFELIQKKSAIEEQKIEEGFEGLYSKFLFKNEGGEYSVHLVQSFSAATGEIESQAWRKLLQVLTHELMNSVTSIASLSESLHSDLKLNNANNEWQLIADRIAQRSLGLMGFVENYKSVSEVNASNKEWVKLNLLLTPIINSMRLNYTNIDLQNGVEDKLMVYADTNQFGQVLHNLLLNAVYAVQDVENAKIQLIAKQENQIINLDIIDNGVGVKPEFQSKIFIPFFTTREAGKGIGLSLSRQLMLANGGGLSLKTSTTGNTVFRIRILGGEEPK